MQEAEKRTKRNRTIRNLVLLLIPLVIIFVVLQLTKSDDSDKQVVVGDECRLRHEGPDGQAHDDHAGRGTGDDDRPGEAVHRGHEDELRRRHHRARRRRRRRRRSTASCTLAKSGFYDGTLFHRIVTDFVDQGGDPTGTGNGGPGYTLPDEPPTDGYQAGSVAMANAGTGTTGSQFFLVVSDNGAQQLGTAPPYKYSALGTMDAAGLKVAKKINTFGSADSAGTPTKKVYVNSVQGHRGRRRRHDHGAPPRPRA